MNTQMIRLIRADGASDVSDSDGVLLTENHSQYFVAGGGNSVEISDTDGLIKSARVVIATSSGMRIKKYGATSSLRIQLGNLARTGIFYKVADSE